MRIDAGTNYPYANQRAVTGGADRGGGTSFSAALTAATSDTLQADTAHPAQTDFASMTRQEMREWTNEKVRRGEMSLDESFPFMAMTMKIPVNGGLGSELVAESDGTRYDYGQIVRDGIESARSRNDETTLKMLESAMQIIQRHQGQTIGVDVRTQIGT